MSLRIAFRAVAVVLTTVALGGPALASGAQAATPAFSAPVPAQARTATVAADNPFEGIDLSGLHAEQRTMWPAGNPVRYWALVLDTDLAEQEYSGGTFFLYAPATGEFGWFLDADIPQRTVDAPAQVVIADPGFLKTHPRVEIRYGTPDMPEQARTVATAATWR
ncbi:hypothetical protein [Streptomyces chrestomyceticus]|uniref:hypothetical protein n=1 Tax=Streptomyces chrestomyceticus TaxID=68185 RepID=UPI0019D081BB|nr:hypothetical protein [Streptomyces chrestomyceticus]